MNILVSSPFNIEEIEGKNSTKGKYEIYNIY